MDEHILKDIHILKLNILGCDTDLQSGVRRFFPVRVDTLEVLHLLHEDKPHMRRSCNCTAGDRLHYPDVIQKFCTRTSSGNSVIYNNSFTGLR
jgi:hypothetical protein